MTGADPTQVRWLDGTSPPANSLGGVTWGVPWARGALPASTSFALRDGSEREVPVQSWVSATWPDGSLKWTAHAAPITQPSSHYTIVPGVAAARPVHPVSVTSDADVTDVDTGTVRIRVRRGSASLIETLERGSTVIASGGRLVSERSADPEGRDRVAGRGVLEHVEVEQSGPVRAVLRLTGRHTDAEGSWLPFRVRLYCYAGSDQIRIVHTMVWDGNPERDFLCGLGLRFDVPIDAPLHHRHVRIAGSQGFLTEAARGVTGIWRDPGAEVRRAQVAGDPAPPTTQWTPGFSSRQPPLPWSERLEHIPAWSDWTLAQLSPDGYTMRKRTHATCGWVPAPSGTRSRGYGYVGSPRGGLELGLRDFWQSYPTQLDIADAVSDVASLTMWMWSPQAQPMDVRFYHQGLLLDDPIGQKELLDLTYEDFQPTMGSAHGIARTHELTLRVAAHTPSHPDLDARARACAAPAQLVCTPERIKSAGVFGTWSLPDRSTPAAAAIEDRLGRLVTYYRSQVEQRRWYGFWDYGDVMHHYDLDRHTWRYDVGGFAWDNSELSPDLWLWLSFLRTGDAATYRLAEAMTRHTGEVDVYHTGPYARFGTRHNVQHWGCSCKQLRISSAVYRRYLYYLTADERIGDLLDEQTVTEDTFVAIDRNRAIGSRGRGQPDPDATEIDLGIDLGAILASWLTEWERTGDPTVRVRIETMLREVATLPNGYFTGIARREPQSGRLAAGREQVAISHLSAVFGIFEVIDELTGLIDAPEFEEAWLRYCRFYLAEEQEQEAILGMASRGGLPQGHTRLLAWAAHRLEDPRLAERAWKIFLTGAGDAHNLNELPAAFEPAWVLGPDVAEPVQEITQVKTNDAAQYGLAAIQNLALIRPWLDDVAGELQQRGPGTP